MLVFEYLWMFFLLPLPFPVWLLLPAFKEEQQAVRVPFFEEVTATTGLKAAPGAVILKTNIFQKILAPLCWVLIVTAMARPQWVEDPIEKIRSARDLLLAVDISQSMQTKDFVDPQGQHITRLDAVKQVLDDFISRRKGDRIGLVVFGGAAYPQVPFTLDHQSCRLLLKQTEVGMAGPRTMIGDAIGLGIKLFENSQAEDRIVLLLTDGNDTGSKMPPLKAAEIAKQRGITIYAIGIGDASASGEDKVDLTVLQEIAEITNGIFFRGEDRQKLEAVYHKLDELAPQNYESLSYRPKRPLYHWPLGAAMSLLVVFYGLMLGWTSLQGGRLKE
ncbi:MAG: VWA domain-containing protein [Candidatus Poribacteria bacterium]|nr:VWA domain-containing protein [Candidatus Poribacteria bacterium]